MGIHIILFTALLGLAGCSYKETKYPKSVVIEDKQNNIYIKEFCYDGLKIINAKQSTDTFF